MARRPGPDFLIVSDLPLRVGHPLAAPMPDAIRLVLRDHGFQAGPHTVGYQSCDNSTVQAGGFDFDKCVSNVKDYALNARVMGVIGPIDSPCAFAQIPIANEAPGGPLAMISPSNSYPGLTRAAPFVPAGQLRELYPTGTRNYVRIYPADHAQAAALAVLADELGLSSLYLLHDGPEYGQAMAVLVRQAAGRLGSRSQAPAGGMGTPRATATSPGRSGSRARTACSSPDTSSRTRARCSMTCERSWRAKRC